MVCAHSGKGHYDNNNQYMTNKTIDIFEEGNNYRKHW